MEKKISLFVLGDFFPEKNICSRLNQYDVQDSSNKWLINYTDSSDLVVVNLECPITKLNNPLSKTGPVLRGDISGLKFLKKIGCNLVTTANNHILDYGTEGLEDTINSLKSYEIDFIGSGLNQEDTKKIKYFNVNGSKVAILNFSENEWSTSLDNENPGASSLNEISNFYDIQEAKKNADRIVVITHGGNEMYNLPSPRVKCLLRFFVDVGADAVINHHTHCVSGYEKYKGKPIFYSLGNFIFEDINNESLSSKIGMGVKLVFSEDHIDFETKYFKQCKNPNSLLEELKKEETQQILLEKNSLNEIIGSDKLLKQNFEKWVKKNSKQYNSYLEPHNLKIIASLQFRGLFPSFWSDKKRKYLLNLIRCEAHNDVLKAILKNENSDSKHRSRFS